MRFSDAALGTNIDSLFVWLLSSIKIDTLFIVYFLKLLKEENTEGHIKMGVDNE